MSQIPAALGAHEYEVEEYVVQLLALIAKRRIEDHLPQRLAERAVIDAIEELRRAGEGELLESTFQLTVADVHAQRASHYSRQPFEVAFPDQIDLLGRQLLGF